MDALVLVLAVVMIVLLLGGLIRYRQIVGQMDRQKETRPGGDRMAQSRDVALRSRTHGENGAGTGHWMGAV
jgi:hypothetical protein